MRSLRIWLFFAVLLSGCNLFSASPTSEGSDTGPDVPLDVCDQAVVDLCAALDSECGATDASAICEAEVACGSCDADAECIANRCVCVPELLPLFCERLGVECGPTTAADNCGVLRESVDCGACPGDGTFCESNACVCTPELDEDFCTRLVKSCGSVSDNDNCGVARTVDCGSCTAPATCGGGGTTNVCACPSQTDVDFCAANAATCGALTAVDECGQMRTVDCGACNAPETCAGGGVDNTCGCTPESDSQLCGRLGAVCDSVTEVDNCEVSRTVDCGVCPNNDLCVNNQCVCVPESEGEFCTRLVANCDALTAPDNCGDSRSVASCGTCTAGEACTANRCNCMAEDDAAFCARLGSECGATSGDDDCLNPRSVASCGACAVAGESCSANQCVCVPESDAEFCVRANVGCGATAGTDNCGQPRNVTECGPCAVGSGCSGDQCVMQAGCGDMVCDFGEVQTCIADCPDRPIAISAGGTHTCAVLGDGSVLCWGQNNRGQFGTGNITSSPTPVTTGFAGVASISAGLRYTLVRQTANVLGAGINFRGQLGDNTTTDRRTPVVTSGLSTATVVGAGFWEHSCALLADGTVSCWGRNFRGQLGDGTTIDSLVPQTVPSITGATAIGVGAEHSCAVVSGDVSCWGRNGSGQLGNGGIVNSPSPVAVSSLTNADAVGGGKNHSCALTLSGEVHCWGTNLLGQVGDGTVTQRNVPTRVSNFTAVQIAVGGDHSCALRADGTISCWGQNLSGQLGDGSFGGGLSPVNVDGLSDVFQITAGDRHTCALLLDGTARCWGSSINEALGDGSIIDQPLPVQPMGL